MGDHNGVRVVYPRASNYLQDQRLNLNAGINRELGRHMEARLLSSEILVKCGVFWSQPAAKVEAFQLHLVTTTYGEGSGTAWEEECWIVVLTMVWVIWWELRKVSVEAKTSYGSDNLT